MKNLPAWARALLCARLPFLSGQTAGEALASYSPTGWCAGVSRPGESPRFFWGGYAVLPGDRAPPAAPASPKGLAPYGIPAGPDTVFRVASVSKMVGAAAALRLARQGKLSLDGDIADVLGFSAGRVVTLRQLLTHTAGLDDRAYNRAVGAPDAPALDALLPRSLFPYPPGTRVRYSNLGAGVAGMLVEAAAGMLFDDYVRQEFFAPHGIDASFHPQRIKAKERMANCYRVPGRALAYDAQAVAAQPLDGEPDPRRHYAVPAGKLMISAPDLLGTLAVLQAEEGEMFIRQAHRGSVLCDAGRGMGAAVAPGVFAKGRTLWGHQGVAYGAVCEAWLDPSDGTAAVVLTNGARLGAIGPMKLAGHGGVAALLRAGTVHPGERAE